MSAERWHPIKAPRDRGAFRWSKHRHGGTTVWHLTIYHAPMAPLHIEVCERGNDAAARRWTAWRLRQVRAAFRKEAALRRAYTETVIEFS